MVEPVEPEFLAALLVVVFGAVATFRKHKRIAITDLPVWWYRDLKYLIYRFRVDYFTYEVDEHRDLYVGASVDEVRYALAAAYFSPGWFLALNYLGEDLNMRRSVLDRTRECEFQQDHARGFEEGHGWVGLRIHREPDPIMHPWEHLDGSDMRTEEALVVVESILIHAGYSPTRERPAVLDDVEPAAA